MKAYLNREFIRSYTDGVCLNCERLLGAHPETRDGKSGCRFSIFAPEAESVSVIGDFCLWKNDGIYLYELFSSGVWSAFVPNVRLGSGYKFIVKAKSGKKELRMDPFSFTFSKESQVWKNSYLWLDRQWTAERKHFHHRMEPMNIFRIDLMKYIGNLRQKVRNIYPHLIKNLIPYVKSYGYTHISLALDKGGKPKLFDPCSMGSFPEELMNFVDMCHGANIGVILDWEIPEGYRQRLSNPPVKNMLISSSLYYLREFHVDGLNVIYDAPKLGAEGYKNIFSFFSDLTYDVKNEFPHVFMLSACPVPCMDYNVCADFSKTVLSAMADKTRPDKCDSVSPPHPKIGGGERRIISLKAPLCSRERISLENSVCGSFDERMSRLRLLHLYQMCVYGKKMRVCGGENELETLLQGQSYAMHRLCGFKAFIKDLNLLYKTEPTLFCGYMSSLYILSADGENVEAFLRSSGQENMIIAVLNFSDRAFENFPVSVPKSGTFSEIFNSDDLLYLGGGNINTGYLKVGYSDDDPEKLCLKLTVPPLGGVLMKRLNQS